MANKKRRHSRTVELKRQMEQEKLANEKSRAKNRWNPAGQALLWLLFGSKKGRDGFSGGRRL